MKDILLDEDNDLVIQNGDFKIGISDEQHKKLLLISDKGTFKQYPDVGVGIFGYLQDESTADLFREIRLQFTSDGMKVNSIRMENGKIVINANYGDASN